MARGMTKLHTLLAGVVPYGASQVPSFSTCNFKNELGEPMPIFDSNGHVNSSLRDSVENTLKEAVNINPEVYIANYFMTDDICIHERNSLIGKFEGIIPDMVYQPEDSDIPVTYKELCESLGIKNTSVLRDLNVLGHGTRDVLIINFDMSKFNLNDQYGKKLTDSINGLLKVMVNNFFYLEIK